MTGTWKPSIPGGPDDPAEPAAQRRRRTGQLPRTLWAGIDSPDSGQRVFDPALKHFSKAYRPLDPASTPEWRTARRGALDAVLAAVARSPWADSLVLRGSMTMSTWFGERAREPKDIDFVVTPADWDISARRTAKMLADLTSAAGRLAGELSPGLTIDEDAAVREYIWTYERVPGYRLVLPWRREGLPGGQVQLDFVFNEHLPVEPVRETVRGVALRVASRELSLAWKVQWLVTDLYAQGKDLYDAVLLAESVRLDPGLLHEVFRLSGEWPDPRRESLRSADVREGVQAVEWHHFADEYPQFAHDERVYAQRLLTALAPTFAGET